MRKQLTHSEILAAAAKAERDSQYRVFPGIVQAYHPGGQGQKATVDVQIAVNDVRTDIDTGAQISETADVITGIPVLWPRFGGFVIKGPLAQNDEVTLIAYDLDPSQFRSTGRVSDPPDVKRHGGNYWCALPCGIADTNGTSSDGASVLTIGVDGGAAQIQISGSSIQLGNNGTDHVALASIVDGILNGLVNKLTTIGSTPLTGASLAAAIQTVWLGTPGANVPPTTTGSSLIKAQ